MMRYLSLRLAVLLATSWHLWLPGDAVSPVRAADVTAIAGEPLGVAQVTLPFSDDDTNLELGRVGISLSAPPQRALYPAVTDGISRRALFGRPRKGPEVTVMFLFRGDAPFEVTVATPKEQVVQVTPQPASQLAYRRLLRQWWRGYNSMFRDLEKQDEPVPAVGDYLTGMLARRLSLQAPLRDRVLADMRQEDEGHETLELLAGAEAVRRRLTRAASVGVAAGDEARFALPEAVPWPAMELPEFDESVSVEPLAKRVPRECFYVRFGQFANLLWLTALMEDYGGELSSMAFARGYRTRLSARIQSQLVLQQGVLSELLGPQVVSDVAAIGLDTFTRDGAALGILFEVRGPLLGVELARQRREALARERGATMEDVQVGGRQVSFLSTPDNRLRSFYVVDGKYHLVSNSRALVRRFLEVADGPETLGASDEFQYARSAMPLERDDTIFVYCSSHFFRNLLGPACQIEMYRRIRSTIDNQLLTLAQLVARAEGVPSDSINELIQTKFLPPGFGQRPDGSQPVIVDGTILDSLRGADGFFTPAADMPVESVTDAERQRYLQQARVHVEREQQVDPVMLVLKRYALQGDRMERVTFDAFLTPMDGFKVRFLLSMLGEPEPHRLVPPKNNVLCIDASVRGGILFRNIPPHRLFLGLQDREPLAPAWSASSLRLLSIVRTAPGFLGAWPESGFLDLIPFVSGVPDQDGISQLPLSVLRWQGRGFSLLSMDEEILTDAGAQVGFVEDPHAAQLRVSAGDLSKARCASWLNQIGYERARQVSLGNARWISLLAQQLHVPFDEAQRIAEQLVGAQLVCSLGGEYEAATGSGPRLRSTAWPSPGEYQMPDDYVTPVLQWFRGLDARLVKHPGRITVHGHVDMQRKERDAAIPLPLLNLLGKPDAQKKSSPESPSPTRRDFQPKP
jgi:hypothetical protein